MRRDDFVKAMTIRLVKAFREEGIDIMDYPVVTSEILRIICLSWAKTLGIPPVAAADLIDEVADKFRKSIVDKTLN